MAKPHVSFIFGGARSGKSLFAEQLAVQISDSTDAAKIYIATATAGDAEMTDRIAKHKDRRGNDWALVEEPLALAEALKSHAAYNRVLLIDCITLWLTNILLADRDITAEIATLVETLQIMDGHLILVSNEVGLGIVPDTALGRRFQDFSGQANREIAAVADYVAFVAAGLPLTLKGSSPIS